MSWLTEPWGSEIVRLAGIELVLLGSVAGALGVFVVLRGLSFATEALAHAVLPGAVAAAILGGPIAVGAAATASITALALGGAPPARLQRHGDGGGPCRRARARRHDSLPAT